MHDGPVLGFGVWLIICGILRTSAHYMRDISEDASSAIRRCIYKTSNAGLFQEILLKYR